MLNGYGAYGQVGGSGFGEDWEDVDETIKDLYMGDYGHGLLDDDEDIVQEGTFTIDGFGGRRRRRRRSRSRSRRRSRRRRRSRHRSRDFQRRRMAQAAARGRAQHAAWAQGRKQSRPSPRSSVPIIKRPPPPRPAPPPLRRSSVPIIKRPPPPRPAPPPLRLAPSRPLTTPIEAQINKVKAEVARLGQPLASMTGANKQRVQKMCMDLAMVPSYGGNILDVQRCINAANKKPGAGFGELPALLQNKAVLGAAAVAAFLWWRSR